jgi:hypothetical protein
VLPQLQVAVLHEVVGRLFISKRFKEKPEYTLGIFVYRLVIFLN